jgi:hypothetical protein
LSDVTLFKGNSSPLVSDTITVNGVAQDLTGCTISFQARDPRTSTLVLNVSGSQIVILNQTTNKGGVTYAPNSTDTAVAYVVPPLVGWWHVVLASGAVQDTPEFNVYIQAHGPAATTDLCTLSDLKVATRITEQVRNGEIEAAITAASIMIMRYCDREFAPASTGVTRTFPIDISGGDLVVELNPYDLRTATTVTLSPEGAATVLTATQYSLEPVNNPDGTYKRIKISPFVGGIISVWALNFGYAKLSITGNWGFPAVPIDVKKACITTVQSWIDVAYAAYASRDAFSDEIRQTFPPPESTYGLPVSAQRMLSTYRRMVP